MEGEKKAPVEEACYESSSKKKLKTSQKSKESKTTEFVEKLNENEVPAILKKSDAESETRESIHPLLVDHILEKIFKLIIDPIRKKERHRPDVGAISRDVRSFRLVCNTWRVVATSVFRNARSIMNIGDEHLDLDLTWEYPDFQLGRFLKVMKNSTMVPFQSYKICRSVLTSRNSQLMKLFLEVCGPEMVELQIAICGTDLSTGLVIPGDVAHLKLQKLSTFGIVIIRNYFSHLEDGDVVKFIGFLLTITKSLKNFTMIYSENPDRAYMQSVWNGVQKFFGKLPSTLKSIKLSTTNYSDFYLNTIQKNNMKLENFEFTFIGGHLPPGIDETIYAFFKGQSQTLKKLRIPSIFLAPKPESKQPITFGQLDSLKLRIRQLPILIKDHFPKLAILDLSFDSLFWDEPTYMELLSVTAPIETVTELRLPGTSFGASAVERIAKFFPNVQKLAFGLPLNFTAPNPFQHVFVYFPQLIELDVSLHNPNRTRNECGESYLCNISSDECERALLRDFNDFNSKMLQENPSILLLKKLKKLMLKGCNGIKFTDFGAHFIFLQMESLEELHIDSEPGHMSADYVSRLKNKLKILRIEE